MSSDSAAATVAPLDERRRQHAVVSLGLAIPVRQESDERLDRITRLAQRLFDAAWTSITVLDEDRAWFPSAQGFDIEEMAREDTFCDRTTRARTFTVVPDATADPRYSGLTAVRESGIRFYAGVPLLDSQDNAVGVLCLYDTRVRTLSADEELTLKDLAVWAEQELVTHREMTRAGQVQASLLPSQPIKEGDWQVAGICLPAQAVGGDLYDYALTGHVLHLGLGDVMGKGTGAALVGAGVRAAVRATHASVIEGTNLGTATTRVAQSLVRDLERAETFVTLFQAAIDLRHGVMRYVDAGSGLCLLVRGDGRAELLSGEDRPLGVFRDDKWAEHLVPLDAGDKLLLFSDGVLDLLDDPDDWVTEVAALVRSHDDAGSLLAELRRATREAIQLDDVTAVAVYCGDAVA
jgi:sigma-B regulation protein RsbU (phosphoserine phosphatase)